MTSAPNFVVLGHHGSGADVVRVHHIPLPGETVTAWDYHLIKDGGKGSNQAIVISRLGGCAAFIGKIGDDERSELSQQWLIDDGVNIKHLLHSNQRVPRAGLIMIDDAGVNSIVSMMGICNTLSFEEVKSGIEDFKTAKYFITGFEIPISTALSGAKLAKELGMLTILNPAPAPEESLICIDYIDIIILNEIEAKIMADLDLHKGFNPDQACIKIRDKYNVNTLIITLGSNGVFGFDGENSWSVSSIPVNAIDTTGAGDAFIGGFAYALDRGKSTLEAIEWGNYVAAFSVAREGTISSFPKLKEVEEFIEANRIINLK